MKKIACFIENLEIFESIKRFCEVEDFELYDISSSEFKYDHGIVIVISDKYVKIQDIDFKDIPICLIGERSNSISYYSLDSNFTEHQLRALIDTVYQGGILASFTSAVKLKKISKQIIIDNDIFNIDRIVNTFTKELVHFFTISEIQKIRIGISEILTNAIEHGNLSISGDEKFRATEAGTYMELIEERLNDPNYKDRKVLVEININKDILKINIEDSGDGFNISEVEPSNNPEDLLKLHGRGILITKMYFDEVLYNKKGNKVTLVKKRDS
jgi:anti-sigma regulatory factor (Ser/Thr protein kinase)